MFKCKICNSEFDSEVYQAAEVRFGLGNKFDYIHCPHCDCLQIKDIPSDLDRYYDSGQYYSLQARSENDSNSIVRRYMRKYLLKYRMGGKNIVGRLISEIDKGAFEWILPDMNMTFDSSVLDIGCGSGRTLLKIAQSGCHNVSGIEPYIDKDITYHLPQQTVNIYKKSITDLEGKYDIILMNHVIEHLTNPHESMEAISNVMHSNSTLVVALPIESDFTWKHYGIAQFQLADAPRHIFIYSINSLSRLASQHGMEIKRVKYYASDKILYDVYGNMCDEIKIKQQDKSKLKEELIHNAETGLAYVYFKKK